MHSNDVAMMQAREVKVLRMLRDIEESVRVSKGDLESVRAHVERMERLLEEAAQCEALPTDLRERMTDVVGV